LGIYSTGDRTTIEMPFPPRSGIAMGTGWTVSKLLFVTSKTIRQPLIIRGTRIDGPGEAGFTGHAGRRPFQAIQFAPQSRAIDLGRLKAFGVIVWATASGCYEVQIDGETFSRIIVFRVELKAA